MPKRPLPPSYSEADTARAIDGLRKLLLSKAVQRDSNPKDIKELSELITKYERQYEEGGAEVAPPSPAHDGRGSGRENPHRPVIDGIAAGLAAGESDRPAPVVSPRVSGALILGSVTIRDGATGEVQRTVAGERLPKQARTTAR